MKLEKQIQIETDAAFLYEVLSQKCEDHALAEIFRKMAAIESRHAARCLKKMQDTLPTYSAPQPSIRAKILVYLSYIFGINIVLSQLINSEALMTDRIIKQKAQQGMHPTGFENLHLNIVKSISARKDFKDKNKWLTAIEGNHSTISGNELRAAVLGANDGLISNLSLVMGVLGATSGQTYILIAGTAGLIAGAISMAMGEWLSVQSSRELYQRQIEIEEEELEHSPEEEKEELILLYQAKGIPEEAAKVAAEEIFKDRDTALAALIKEELGIDNEELGGSPWKAAIASFLLFAVGASIPLLPYLFLEGTIAQITSLICSAIGLFLLGAAITIFTGKSVLYSGMRQVLFGLGAAGITYTIGTMIGISIVG